MKNLFDLQEIISEFFSSNTKMNSAQEINLSRIIDEPLVGIASADDPIFKKLKEPEIIGENHLLPTEWLPEAKSVISFFLPFSKKIRVANRSKGLPAMEWVYARWEGEICNHQLKKYLVKKLEELGNQALAPAITTERFQIKEKKSNWSERHVAYIAGLGTFGLGRSLITPKGSAGRFGSIITTRTLEPTQHRYQPFLDYCNTCLKCVTRCPSNALKPEGKDIWICSKYLDNIIKPKYEPRYGCGKCQTEVPCEASMPIK